MQFFIHYQLNAHRPMSAKSTPDRRWKRQRASPSPPAELPLQFPFTDASALPDEHVVLKARAMFASARAEELKNERPKDTYSKRRASAQSMWSQLDAVQKDIWLAKARASLSPPVATAASQADNAEAEPEVADEGLAHSLPAVPGKQRFRGCHGLASWNGAWGVVSLPGAQLNELSVLVKALQENPEVQQLWQEFRTWSETWDKRLSAKHSSLQMEVSTESSEIRVHLHKYFSLETAIDWTSTCLLEFKSSRPDLRMNHARGEQQEKSVNRGHYYASAPKEGKVFGFTSKQPHFAYIVDPSWPTSLWVERKLSHRNYRAELVAGRQQLISRLRNLDMVEQLEKEMREAEELTEALLKLNLSMGGFREIHEVEAWKKTLMTIKHRYRFLVLVGPSGLGKTEYVKSLSGPDKTFECDCSATQTPDMKGFDRRLHRTVLFDEAGPALILGHKKLFQAHISGAVLGQTTTGAFSYKVWTWKCLLVVATNKWSLDGLEAADAAWLTANSVVVMVTDPLFVPKP